ncbi:MAG: restriction endonuclease subunit S [Steroidobacteraceae bacterium]
MSELPTGWIEVPIGTVCEVVGGSTPRTAVSDYWDGDIPWLTPDDLSRDHSQYVAGGRRCLTEAGYSSCSTQLIPAGSVLYTSRAPIGYVAIAKQAAAK